MICRSIVFPQLTFSVVSFLANNVAYICARLVIAIVIVYLKHLALEAKLLLLCKSDIF